MGEHFVADAEDLNANGESDGFLATWIRLREIEHIIATTIRADTAQSIDRIEILRRSAGISTGSSRDVEELRRHAMTQCRQVAKFFQAAREAWASTAYEGVVNNQPYVSDKIQYSGLIKSLNLTQRRVASLLIRGYSNV